MKPWSKSRNIMSATPPPENSSDSSPLEGDDSVPLKDPVEPKDGDSPAAAAESPETQETVEVAAESNSPEPPAVKSDSGITAMPAPVRHPSGDNTSDEDEDEDEEEEEDDGSRMGFLDHLMELRRRLMGGVIAVFITTILSFVFYSHIFAFLRVPIDNINQQYRDDPELSAQAVAIGLDPQKGVIVPISTEPLGLIMILMKVAVITGIVLSSPIVVYQFWSFVSPGLKKSERRAIQPLLLGGLMFFVGGASFCYYLVFPLTLNFLVWLDVSMGFAPQYTPNHYIGLLVTFMLIFGLVFELPLVASILALLRILSPEFLTRYWRYVILACFLLGSILSPGGDPMSMLMMSGSMVVLYVVSIFLVKMLYPKEEA